MTDIRSSLAGIAPLCRESDPTLGRQACAAVWHRTGLLVANPEQHGWARAQEITNLGNALYGKRKGDAGGKKDQGE